MDLSGRQRVEGDPCAVWESSWATSRSPAHLTRCPSDAFLTLTPTLRNRLLFKSRDTGRGPSLVALVPTLIALVLETLPSHPPDYGMSLETRDEGPKLHHHEALKSERFLVLVLVLPCLPYGPSVALNSLVRGTNVRHITWLHHSWLWLPLAYWTTSFLCLAPRKRLPSRHDDVNEETLRVYGNARWALCRSPVSSRALFLWFSSGLRP